MPVVKGNPETASVRPQWDERGERRQGEGTVLREEQIVLCVCAGVCVFMCVVARGCLTFCYSGVVC